MKKLLVLLFSLLFLSSPSVFAEDISDFQIEGISIGDSLLDYMTEDEILEEIELNKNAYSHLNESNKYAEVFLSKYLPTYDALSVFVNNNSSSKYVTNKNEKYIIQSVSGKISYGSDIESCFQKKDEIEDELSKVFSNAEKWEIVFKSQIDPSGNSNIDAIYFDFDIDGRASVKCYNYDEKFRIKNNRSDYLEVSVDSVEIISWISDY
jgi:hypothetical protein